MPRPRSLDAFTLASAALTVIEREGLAGLSMRAVAAELGMGAMSLYRYVENKEQLEGLIVEHVLSGLGARSARESGAWHERVTVLALDLRRAVREHRTIVPL